MKFARRATLLVTLVWWLHGIPFVLFQDITPQSSACVYTNSGLSRYQPVFRLLILNGIPITIMVVFGYLVYRNVSRVVTLAQHNVDRQLTIMVCMQIFLAIFSRTPNGIFFAYNTITTGVSRNANQAGIELLISSITNLLAYMINAVRIFCFSYISMISSVSCPYCFRDDFMSSWFHLVVSVAQLGIAFFRVQIIKRSVLCRMVLLLVSAELWDGIHMILSSRLIQTARNLSFGFFFVIFSTIAHQ